MRSGTGATITTGSGPGGEFASQPRSVDGANPKQTRPQPARRRLFRHLGGRDGQLNALPILSGILPDPDQPFDPEPRLGCPVERQAIGWLPCRAAGQIAQRQRAGGRRVEHQIDGQQPCLCHRLGRQRGQGLAGAVEFRAQIVALAFQRRFRQAGGPRLGMGGLYPIGDHVGGGRQCVGCARGQNAIGRGADPAEEPDAGLGRGDGCVQRLDLGRCGGQRVLQPLDIALGRVDGGSGWRIIGRLARLAEAERADLPSRQRFDPAACRPATRPAGREPAGGGGRHPDRIRRCA
jgi:hypothetical protein